MLSGEGETVKRNNRSNQQKKKNNFARAAHFFSYIYLLLFCTTTTQYFQKLFLWRKCRMCSRSLLFHCRSFSPYVGGRQHFSFFHHRYKLCMLFFQQKMSPLFFISRSISLSPFFSLSFAGLPPTLSFSLSFCCSIFQICGHDN